jgi:choline dehydrogenase
MLTAVSGRDVIVVGAGSTGAVLAARLSENESRSVLLVEAGPDYRSAETVAEVRSSFYPRILERGGYHWPGLLARNNDSRQPVPYHCGFGVGGSSSINATFALRPPPDDFATWPAGWSWEEVLPSFIRLETDLDHGDQGYHGSDGPVLITRRAADRWGRVDVALRDAALEVGHSWCEDINAPDSTGVSASAFTQRDGVRVSTNDAYLEPARNRPNLEILGDALVDRVLIHGERAVGVRVRVGGKWRDELADEVIVSAGALHSPGMLMRSGIGPASRLRALGIQVIVDQPAVGANLQEHPLVRIGLALKPDSRQPDDQFENWLRCCLRFGSGAAGENDLFIASVNSGRLTAALLHVVARGAVDITAADPQTNPVVSFRMLSDQDDLARLRQAVRHAFELATHRAFVEIADAVTVGTTGRSPDELAPDRELNAWLIETCNEFHHPCGTCRMGDGSDPEAVVDSQGRVIGMSGLRVADASIFPNVPRANTNLTAIMVGEHISRLIAARPG